MAIYKVSLKSDVGEYVLLLTAQDIPTVKASAEAILSGLGWMGSHGKISIQEIKNTPEKLTGK